MTIRGLAAELGVAPMSLYRHVRDKNDLFDEVTDGLLAEAWKPRARRRDGAPGRWKQLIGFGRSWCGTSRLACVSPTPRRLSRCHSTDGRHARRPQFAGFEMTEVRRAYGVIHTYTVGFAALEASRGESAGGDDRADDVIRELARLTTPTQFKVGLELLIDGICSDGEAANRNT